MNRVLADQLMFWILLDSTFTLTRLRRKWLFYQITNIFETIKNITIYWYNFKVRKIVLKKRSLNPLCLRRSDDDLTFTLPCSFYKKSNGISFLIKSLAQITMQLNKFIRISTMLVDGQWHLKHCITQFPHFHLCWRSALT